MWPLIPVWGVADEWAEGKKYVLLEVLLCLEEMEPVLLPDGDKEGVGWVVAVSAPDRAETVSAPVVERRSPTCKEHPVIT